MLTQRSCYGFKYKVIVILLIGVIYSATYLILSNHYYKINYISSSICDQIVYETPDDFEGFNNITGEPHGCNIIPNYVHFVKFGQNTFNFPHTICILAALKNQNPEKIFIHTDILQFKGKYWDVLVSSAGFLDKLVINNVTIPNEIFGQPINKNWLKYHGGDITRLRVLMKYGGIYLDNDSCVIRNLDYFRRFEMSVGWKPGKSFGNMVMIAHKNARFLHALYKSYEGNYHPKKFYFNAGDYPTSHILNKRPYLVHREEKLFGNYGPFKPLYLERFPQWKNYYAIHTLSNHLGELKGLSKSLKYPVQFNEENILNYPVAYRDLVLSVYPSNSHDTKNNSRYVN